MRLNCVSAWFSSTRDSRRGSMSEEPQTASDAAPSMLAEGHTVASYNLRLIAQTAGRVAAAEPRCQMVLAIDPNCAPALFNLAIIRSDGNATAEAIELCRWAIGANLLSALADLNLGFGLQRAGEREASRNRVRACGSA